MNILGLGLNRTAFLAKLEGIIPGLQLLALPNRDLATGWTSDIKVVQDFSEGGKVYGSELVVNGDFSAWAGDNPTGWAIFGEDENNYITEDVSGLRIVSDGTAIYMQQTILTSYKKYKIEIDVVSITGRIEIGPVVNVQQVTTPGTHAFEISSENSSTLIFKRAVGYSCDAVISRISVKEITNGNHGIYKNSMELNQVAGRKYYLLDGTDDYINFGNINNFTTQYTMMFCFNTSGLTDPTEVFFCKYDYGLNKRSYAVNIYQKKLILFESGDGTAITQYTINPLVDYNDGEVHQVEIRKNGTSITAKVDGVTATVTLVLGTAVASLYQSDANFLVGARLNSDVPISFYDGLLGYLITSNQYLSDSVIEQVKANPYIIEIIAGMA